MSWSYIPRWKFTDSCGRPRVPGGIHVGCTHDGQMQQCHATRRALLKAGVAIVGGAGLATVVGPREVFAQIRVFPPPPPAVSPIAGLMDTPAVREVLKICAEQKLVVQTGHLSPSEALAVIEAGRDAGVDRMVVTHAQFEVVNMSFEQMKKAASMGAKLELCAMGPLMGPEAHLEWMRHWRRVKVEETAAAVKEVGAQNFILATDLGQTGNPSPADGLQLFVTDLMKAGLTKDQITTMGREQAADGLTRGRYR